MLHRVGTHNAKSMTEKNGGNTTGEVPCVGLCDCGTEQAVLVRWRGVGFFFLGIQMLLKTKNFASLFVNDDFLIVKLSN